MIFFITSTRMGLHLHRYECVGKITIDEKNEMKSLLSVCVSVRRILIQNNYKFLFKKTEVFVCSTATTGAMLFNFKHCKFYIVIFFFHFLSKYSSSMVWLKAVCLTEHLWIKNVVPSSLYLTYFSFSYKKSFKWLLFFCILFFHVSINRHTDMTQMCKLWRIMKDEECRKMKELYNKFE